MPNNDGYLALVAIMQKFVDQTISANTNYDPAKFEGGKVPMMVHLTCKKILNQPPQMPRWKKMMAVPAALVKFNDRTSE